MLADDITIQADDPNAAQLYDALEMLTSVFQNDYAARFKFFRQLLADGVTYDHAMQTVANDKAMQDDDIRNDLFCDEPMMRTTSIVAFAYDAPAGPAGAAAYARAVTPPPALNISDFTGKFQEIITEAEQLGLIDIEKDHPEFNCNISIAIMEEPLFNPAGVGNAPRYDRSWLEKHFERSDEDPITGKKTGISEFTTDLSLKAQIEGTILDLVTKIRQIPGHGDSFMDLAARHSAR